MSAPFPPYTYETAVKKVRGAEDGWNTRNPEKVALAYSVDSYWRNRSEFVVGRPAIIELFRDASGPRPAEHPGVVGLGALASIKIARN
jgi:nuclear transport factor 2 (NTF2) superfamily protein